MQAHARNNQLNCTEFEVCKGNFPEMSAPGFAKCIWSEIYNLLVLVQQFLAELLLQIAVSGAVASSRKYVCDPPQPQSQAFVKTFDTSSVIYMSHRYGIGMVAGVSCLSLLKALANFHSGNLLGNCCSRMSVRVNLSRCSGYAQLRLRSYCSHCHTGTYGRRCSGVRYSDETIKVQNHVVWQPRPHA